jgi:hypothetical protein
MESKIRRQYIKTSLYLYIACLLLPAVISQLGTHRGLSLLVLSIIGLPVAVLEITRYEFYLLTTYPAALANPLYITSLYLTYKRYSYHLSFKLSVLAFFCMLSFLYNPVVPFGSEFKSIMATPHLGYFLWLFSGAFLAYGNYHLTKLAS